MQIQSLLAILISASAVFATPAVEENHAQCISGENCPGPQFAGRPCCGTPGTKADKRGCCPLNSIPDQPCIKGYNCPGAAYAGRACCDSPGVVADKSGCCPVNGSIGKAPKKPGKKGGDGS